MIGAGIGGLMAAIALLRFDIDVEVFEQADEFRRIGAGIQLAPNSARVLDGLGMLEPITSVAFRPTYRISRKWDTGEETSRIEFGAAAQAKYGVPMLMFHRADLLSALENAVPPGKVHLGKQLVKLQQRDSEVDLEFSDSTSIRVDAVIGADGIHSTVREALFGKSEPRFTGISSFRSVIPADEVPWYDGKCFTKWFGPTPASMLVTSLIAQGKELYVFASKAESHWLKESWSSKGDLEVLRASFSGYHKDARRVLDACNEALQTALYDRDPLPTWTKGRVTLLGDACHPMTPFMAQGGAMATEDAIVLARCLQNVSSESIPQALERYELTRINRTSKIQISSRQNEWLGTAGITEWVYGYDAWQTPLS